MTSITTYGFIYFIIIVREINGILSLTFSIYIYSKCTLQYYAELNITIIWAVWAVVIGYAVIALRSNFSPLNKSIDVLLQWREVLVSSLSG